jgi:undecaprenyl-diphosphatase
MYFGLLGAPAHGYLALAAVVGLESMGVPVPGETALVTAGVLAHQGELELVPVIAIAATAAVVGDNLGYLLGAKGGRRLLEHRGPLAQWRRRFVARGERFFARHGARAVFLARFVVGARVAAAWLAGVNRMPWRRFLVWNALGGVSWAVAAGMAGYLLGAVASRLLTSFGIGVLILVALTAALAYGWHRVSTHRPR